MEYISKFIKVMVDGGVHGYIDVTTVDTIGFKSPAITHVYTAGCSSPLRVAMHVDKVAELIETKLKELWEAQHTVDELKIQLLAEIRDNTKLIDGDPFELVNQMREQFLSGGLYGTESSKPGTESNS